MSGAVRWGYARVSTEGQELDTQRGALAAAGVEPRHIFADVGTGREPPQKRPQWLDLSGRWRPGDVVLVTEVSRLGRNVRELLGTLHAMQAESVGFRSLKEGLTTEEADPMGRAMLTMFAVFAELEADFTRARTMEGLRRARELGRSGGRQPALTPEQAAEALGKRRSGATLRALGEHYGCSRDAVRRAVARAEAKDRAQP